MISFKETTEKFKATTRLQPAEKNVNEHLHLELSDPLRWLIHARPILVQNGLYVLIFSEYVTFISNTFFYSLPSREIME
jgi:hypothetical protein